MYLYETHMHTSPTSACARVSVREALEFYKAAGYAGVAITNHFIDGNIAYDLRDLPYEERIRAFFSACDEGEEIGKEIGLTVFPGFEMSHGGTDFLVYGIDCAWCLAHPEIEDLPKSRVLPMMAADGALIIQAHPFREGGWIDHVRLYPRNIHGVEVYNANRNEFENRLADQFCENYDLIRFAGSDNHVGARQVLFGGIATDEEPLRDLDDFIAAVRDGRAMPFMRNEDGVTLL